MADVTAPGQPRDGQTDTATAPPQTGYTRFRDMLKHPSAKPVVQQIFQFVMQFPGRITRQVAADSVSRFLSTTQEFMLTECVVFAAEADEEGRTNAAEGLEKFVITKMHATLFNIDPADQREDELLARRIASLQWVDFQHLGVPPVTPQLLSLAVDQLRQVDAYKAPSDKIICVLNACRVINDVLARTLAAAEGGRPLSADDFLPLLIYAVLKANPPRLHSNLEFISAFRHPTRLVAEDAYFLTALRSAVAFARDATPKELDVSSEDYDSFCKSAALVYDQAQAERAAVETAALAELPPREEAQPRGGKETLSPAARSMVRARLGALELRFDKTETSSGLRIRDVAALLDEYKALASILRDVEAAMETR